MKKILSLTAIATALCLAGTLSFAEDHLSRLHVFQNACTKSCHTNDANGGVLETASKTKQDWRVLLQNEQAKLKAVHSEKSLDLNFIAKRHPNLDATPWSLVEEHVTTYAFNSDEPDPALYR